MASIFVATVEHKHGTNTYAGETYLLAYSAVVDYVRDYWHEVGTDEPPTDEEIMVSLYFAAMEDEWYNVEEIALIQARSTAEAAS